jgi:uncharacterized phage-like protein YoqJ
MGRNMKNFLKKLLIKLMKEFLIQSSNEIIIFYEEEKKLAFKRKIN